MGRASRDQQRDRALERLGYRVLRLDAQLVLSNIERAVEAVRAAVGA